MIRRNSTLKPEDIKGAIVKEGGEENNSTQKGGKFSVAGALGFGSNEEEKQQEQAKMSNLLLNVWDGVDLDSLVNSVRTDVSDGSPARITWWHLSLTMRAIADDKRFQNFIIIVILVAGTMVGIQTDKEFDKENKETLDFIDNWILNIFIVEVVIKVVAEDVFPLRFFTSGWNCFDFLIVVGSLALAGTSSGGMMQMLRLLRLLRVLTSVRLGDEALVLLGLRELGGSVVVVEDRCLDELDGNRISESIEVQSLSLREV